MGNRKGQRCLRVDAKGRRISGLMRVVGWKRNAGFCETVDLEEESSGRAVKTITASRCVFEGDPRFDVLLAECNGARSTCPTCGGCGWVKP